MHKWPWHKICWKPQQQFDLDGSYLWGVTVLKPLAWLQVVDILIYKGREELEVSIDVQTAHSLESSEA